MQRHAHPRPTLLTRLLLVVVLLPGLVACRKGATDLTPTATSALLGSVRILSNPAGADVSMAGSKQGETPLDLALAPGTHEITLSRLGYASDVVSITVTAGDEQTVTRHLRDVAPPTVTLTLGDTAILAEAGLKVDAQAKDNALVAFLRLYLNGALVAETAGERLIHNLDTRRLTPGTYELRLIAEDDAGNVAERRARFAVRAPLTATRTTELATTPTALALTPTPEVAAVVTAQPEVVAWWDKVTIETMGYKAGLYTAPERAGHPYSLLDRGAMTPPEPIVYRVLRVRNRYLELVFLPELGGRLYQVRFLPTGQDLFWNAPVIKPTHWGPLDQGWWLAVGGMEWCLPVDEHGYLTAEPWDVVPVAREDGGITVRISTMERTRNMRAQIEVILLPDEAALRITTRLENPNDALVAYQYWMNAILSPGSAGIGPDLRFIVPASQVVVHSTGDGGLPSEHGVMSWPVHQGRDMSAYGNWRNWLGFFATQVDAPFTAVYSPETSLGMARVYPPEVAQGAKLFAFALDFADTSAYTDDGTHYAEMWGGVTPTFWDYATLGAGESLAWQETWWVLTGSGVPCAVSAEASLSAQMAEESLHLVVAAPRPAEFLCQVLRGDAVVSEESVAVRPDAPWARVMQLPQGKGPLVVRLLDEQGAEVLRCTP